MDILITFMALLVDPGNGDVIYLFTDGLTEITEDRNA